MTTLSEAFFDTYFEDGVDLLFEENLKTCHHDLELGFEAISGHETLTCTRCGTIFEEIT